MMTEVVVGQIFDTERDGDRHEEEDEEGVIASADAVLRSHGREGGESWW